MKVTDWVNWLKDWLVEQRCEYGSGSFNLLCSAAMNAHAGHACKRTYTGYSAVALYDVPCRQCCLGVNMGCCGVSTVNDQLYVHMAVQGYCLSVLQLAFNWLQLTADSVSETSFSRQDMTLSWAACVVGSSWAVVGQYLTVPGM
jgi:hypothetical protein